MSRRRLSCMGRGAAGMASGAQRKKRKASPGGKVECCVWSLPLHLHAWKLVEREVSRRRLSCMGRGAAEVWRLAGILDPYSPSYSGSCMLEGLHRIRSPANSRFHKNTRFGFCGCWLLSCLSWVALVYRFRLSRRHLYPSPPPCMEAGGEGGVAAPAIMHGSGRRGGVEVVTTAAVSKKGS